MNCSIPGFPLLHYLLEFAQTHVHWVTDAIQPSHLLLPLLLLPSIIPSIRAFSSELTLHIRWPKYWRFSFSLSPSSEYSGLISFRIEWFDLLAVQEISGVFSVPQFKTIKFFSLSLPTLTSILSAYFITNPASLFSSNILLTHYSSLENKDPRVQKVKQSPQEPVQGIVNTLKELSGTNHIFNERLLELGTATQGTNKLCSVQSLSSVQLFVTPWIVARQASLSITNSQSLSKLMSIERWCHPAISSSIVPFSSCSQSFPASGSFQVSQLLASGCQSIGASASTSVLPIMLPFPKQSQGSGRTTTNEVGKNQVEEWIGLSVGR